MDNKQLKQIVDETCNFLNNKGVGFICIFWHDSSDISGGCNSADADVGEACLAIERIVEHFNISPQALYQALIRVKTNMDGN